MEQPSLLIYRNFHGQNWFQLVKTPPIIGAESVPKPASGVGSTELPVTIPVSVTITDRLKLVIHALRAVQNIVIDRLKW